MPRIRRLSRKNRKRHGFVSRFTYGLLLPNLLLIVVGYFWAQHLGASLPANQKWSVVLLEQRLLLHPAVVVHAVLILPAAFGMCLRLILLSRRTSRMKLFRSGLIAIALATALGVLMFRLLADLMQDLLQ